MTYVVTRPCLGTKDRSCVEVCPVDCFYDIKKKKYNEQFNIMPEGDDGNAEDGDEKIGMLMIHEDECINCGACEPECPVQAIFEDSGTPDEDREFLDLARDELLNMSEEELDASRCTAK